MSAECPNRIGSTTDREQLRMPQALKVMPLEALQIFFPAVLIQILLDRGGVGCEVVVSKVHVGGIERVSQLGLRGLELLIHGLHFISLFLGFVALLLGVAPLALGLVALLAGL